jgi:hypothetical protein
VHGRFFTIAINVGKEQHLGLLELVKVNVDGFLQHKPGDGETGRVRAAAIVPVKEERFQKIAVWVECELGGHRLLQASLKGWVVGIGRLLEVGIAQESLGSTAQTASALFGRALGLVVVVHDLELIQQRLILCIVPINGGPDWYANVPNPRRFQVNVHHLYFRIERFAPHGMLAGHFDIQVDQIGMVRHGATIVGKVGDRRPGPTSLTAYPVLCQVLAAAAVQIDAQLVRLNELFNRAIIQS